MCERERDRESEKGCNSCAKPRRWSVERTSTKYHPAASDRDKKDRQDKHSEGGKNGGGTGRRNKVRKEKPHETERVWEEERERSVLQMGGRGRRAGNE